MQTVVSTVVKVQAIPSSDQYENHRLFLSERERRAIFKADRIIQVEKEESFLYLGVFFFLFSMY